MYLLLIIAPTQGNLHINKFRSLCSLLRFHLHAVDDAYVCMLFVCLRRKLCLSATMTMTFAAAAVTPRWLCTFKADCISFPSKVSWYLDGVSEGGFVTEGCAHFTLIALQSLKIHYSGCMGSVVKCAQCIKVAIREEGDQH